MIISLSNYTKIPYFLDSSAFLEQTPSQDHLVDEIDKPLFTKNIQING